MAVSKQVALSLFASALCACSEQEGQRVAAADEFAPLRVCVEDNDPPRSTRAELRGFDIDVMRAVAAESGREVEFVWVPSAPKIIELEESSFPTRPLRRGECDVVPSLPDAMSLGADAEWIALSRPYYGAGFELIAAETVPADLFALRGRKVSVISVSVGHMAAALIGMDWRAALSVEQQLDELDRGIVDAALIFGPALAVVGREPRKDFEPPDVLRWNFFLGLRDGEADAALRDAVGAALDRIIARGEIETILQRYGVPVHAPFPTTSNHKAMDRLRARASALGDPS